MLGAEKSDGVGDTPSIDRILVRVSEESLQALDDIVGDRNAPVAARIVGRRKVGIFVLIRQPRMRLANGILQSVLRLLVGVEGLSLLNANGPELVDHYLVSFQPRLRLHHAME